jgi:hypothetical protein
MWNILPIILPYHQTMYFQGEELQKIVKKKRELFPEYCLYSCSSPSYLPLFRTSVEEF